MQMSNKIVEFSNNFQVDETFPLDFKHLHIQI